MKTIAKVGGTPASEFRLLEFGTISAPHAAKGGGQWECTPEKVHGALERFNAQDRRLAIDYEHQSVPALNTRPDGLAPAAGWISGVELREDGLYATGVEWTEQARRLIAGGEYAYFSPVLFWADEIGGALEELGPVGLTNDPAMHRVPCLAARSGEKPFTVCSARALQLTAGGAAAQDKSSRGDAEGAVKGGPGMDRIKELLGLPAEATEEDVVAAIESLTAKNKSEMVAARKALCREIATGLAAGDAEEPEALIASVNRRLGEQTTLATRIAAIEKENGELREKSLRAEFNAALALPENSGKIPPADSETFYGIFKRDRKEFEAILRNIPAKTHGASQFEPGEAGAAATAGQHPYEAEIAATVAAKKCTQLEAIRIVRAQKPALFEEYRRQRRAS